MLFILSIFIIQSRLHYWWKRDSKFPQDQSLKCLSRVQLPHTLYMYNRRKGRGRKRGKDLLMRNETLAGKKLRHGSRCRNVHRSTTAATSCLLLLLLFRRLPLLRLLADLSGLPTMTTTSVVSTSLRPRNSCEIYRGGTCSHRGSWQSTSNRESPIHLPWQVEFVDRRRLLLPAISVDSFHLPIPTYRSRLSLSGRSTQIREPTMILDAYRFRSKAIFYYNYMLSCYNYRLVECPLSIEKSCF